MSYVYETTVAVNSWKKHTCVACGCIYQYRVTVEAKGIADTSSFSRSAADERVVAALEQATQPHPCPACGVFQPEMIAGNSLRAHTRVFVAVLVVLLPAAFVAFCGYVSADVVSIGAAVLAAMAAACQAGIVWKDPNTDLAANKALAQREIDDGLLQLVQPASGSEPTRDEPTRRAPSRFSLGLVLVLLAPVALFAPVLAALAFRLPYHRDFSPGYVGPGDRVTLMLGRGNVQGISGLWTGKATATLIAPKKFAAPLRAEAGRTGGYADTIRQGRGAPPTQPCDLFAFVQLPGDPALAGQTVRIRLTMDLLVPIPDPHNSRVFHDRAASVTRDYDVQLADLNHLLVYRSLWWFSIVAGWFGILLGSVLLVYQSCQQRRQTERGVVGGSLLSA